MSCGRGYQMRAVKCVSGIYGTILDDETECNAATRPRDSHVSKTSFFVLKIKSKMGHIWPPEF